MKGFAKTTPQDMSEFTTLITEYEVVARSVMSQHLNAKNKRFEVANKALQAAVDGLTSRLDQVTTIALQ